MMTIIVVGQENICLSVCEERVRSGCSVAKDGAGGVGLGGGWLGVG